MIVNLFLKDKLVYKNIVDYTFLAQFIAALLGSYYSFYKNDVSVAKYIIGSYFAIEINFIPFNNLDVWAHHLASIFSILYFNYYDFGFSVSNETFKQMLQFELSSIFLSIYHYLKTRKKYLRNLIGSYYDYINLTNNMVFISSFCKWRLYKYYFDVYSNQDFYEKVTSDYSITTRYAPYLITNTFMMLNVYWFYLIIKGVITRKNVER
jgi:hypothetical protein